MTDNIKSKLKVETSMALKKQRLLLAGLGLILAAGCEPSYGDPPSLDPKNKDLGSVVVAGDINQNATGDISQIPTTWDCTTGDNGRQTCVQLGPDQGLPASGTNWKCNRTLIKGKPVWVCYGDAAASPASAEWTCDPAPGDSVQWRCTRPEQPGDFPPGGQWWACVKGSEFGGTRCEAVDQEPKPLPPKAQLSATCLPGTLRWCDGLQYCGWGQVTCGADGTWPTKELNGELMLDCVELSSGRRPNTVCGCYHFYYNPDCCERPDCMVPQGTSGQLCGKSGGGLCSYCNPQNPECIEAEARCVVTDQHETFCGRGCSTATPCPTGYICQQLKLLTGFDHQCVPEDFSCYY